MVPGKARILFSVLLLAGCRSTPEIPRSTGPKLGEAYVGPMSLPLRQELAASSATVATLKHGEHLDIVQTRRRFVRVRTVSGTEGWTDAKTLLSTQQMEELQQLAARARLMPSLGAAKSFEPLNMHSRPNRQSPNFHQIPEGGLVDVLAHVIAPRNATDPPMPLLPPAPKPVRKKKKDSRKGKAVQLPPAPQPEVPENWLDLSKTRKPAPTPAELAAEQKKKEQELQRVPAPKLEDWFLVRTPDKKAGWVLARMVSMAIPDEVAQYAEGHRITSYFPLGEVNVEGVVKKHWLWTTTTANGEPIDYDAFRVFIWSKGHHRYETAYQERRVAGYYPIEFHKADVAVGKTTQTMPTFSMLLEDDDGKVYRKTYAFEPSKVRLINVEPAERPKPFSLTAPAPDLTVAASAGPSAPATPKGGWREKLAQFWKRPGGKTGVPVETKQ